MEINLQGMLDENQTIIISTNMACSTAFQHCIRYNYSGSRH